MDERETLGSYLRALREERKGSLADMSLATRVSVGQLEALEADNMAELPAPVFVKGFIRAYCHFLGQPSDEALSRYRELLGADQPFDRALPPSRPASRPAISRSASPMVISLALVIVLGGGLLALKLGFKDRSAPPVVAVAPVVTAPPVVTVTPVVTALPGVTVEPAAKVEPPIKTEQMGKPEPAIKTEQMGKPEPAIKVQPGAARSPVLASPAPASTAGQRLTVKAIELTWLRIQTDDGTAAEALLPPGATREWTAEKRFLLTVGNAGGVELLLNGQPVPPLGAKGAVIRGLQLPQAGAPAGS